MICYHDKTFCSSNCVNTKCWRFIHDKDRRGAKAMNLPMALSDFSGSCPYYEEPKDAPQSRTQS